MTTLTATQATALLTQVSELNRDQLRKIARTVEVAIKESGKFLNKAALCERITAKLNAIVNPAPARSARRSSGRIDRKARALEIKRLLEFGKTFEEIDALLNVRPYQAKRDLKTLDLYTRLDVIRQLVDDGRLSWSKLCHIGDRKQDDEQHVAQAVEQAS